MARRVFLIVLDSVGAVSYTHLSGRDYSLRRRRR